MIKEFLTIACCLTALPALADSPKIEAAKAVKSGSGWRIDVTLSHPDSGWDHYADGWRVLDMSGTEVGIRVLAHPHEHEQPFTRSLRVLSLPQGSTQIQIESRCLVDGWATERFVIDLQ